MKVILVIIGIPILFVIGYIIFYDYWTETKEISEREAQNNFARYNKERERIRTETLDKANALVPKYLKSPLTLLLYQEIKRISAGRYIQIINHHVTSYGETLKVHGGLQKAMYIGDICQLGETSSFATLGYKLPDGHEHSIHLIALVTAIAKKLGSDYRVDIVYDYDNDVAITGLRIINQNVKTKQDLKSPI